MSAPSEKSESKENLINKVFSQRKRRFLGVALLITIVGLIWKPFERSSNARAMEASQPKEIFYDSDYAVEGNQPSMTTNLSTNNSPNIPNDLNKPIESAKKAWKDNPQWSDAAMRLGLSFFVAMVVGSLLRKFVRTMLIGGLVVGAAYWYMVNNGMIDPMWRPDEGMFNSVKSWVTEQSATVVAFFKGSLPSTGAAAMGMIFGLRK